MSRHAFFEKRVQELGLLDADSDYDGMIGKSVLQLSETFAQQGHSGLSAATTMAVFNKLMGEWEKGEDNGCTDCPDNGQL